MSEPTKTAANIAGKTPPDSITGALLDVCVLQAGIEEVEYLILEGADVDAQGPDGDNMRPLHLAICEALFEVAHLLIDYGADVNAVRVTAEYDASNYTPLSLACDWEEADLIARLLAAGADVNADLKGSPTALHSACEQGNLDIVAMLLERGADLEAADSEGETPLDYDRTGTVARFIRARNRRQQASEAAPAAQPENPGPNI